MGDGRVGHPCRFIARVIVAHVAEVVLTLRKVEVALGRGNSEIVLHQCLDAPGFDGRHQRRMVTLILVGIRFSKCADGLVEAIGFTQITTDHGRIAGLGMGTRQNPATHLGVVLEFPGPVAIDR